jgi:hypothetical protein
MQPELAKYNKQYVLGIGLIYAIGGIVFGTTIARQVIGYFFTVLNSSYRVLEIVNGWAHDSRLRMGSRVGTREAIVVALTPFGAIVGSLTGGNLVLVVMR